MASIGAGQPFRTMEIGNVITGTVKAFKAYPGLLLGTSFLLSGLPQGVATYLQNAGLTRSSDLGRQLASGAISWWVVIGVAVVFVLLFIPMTLLMQGLTTRAAMAAIDDEHVTLGDCASVALPRMLPLLGLLIVAGLGILLGLVLLIVPGIVLMVMWYVAVPPLILERTGVFESLGRSADLTRGARWMVLLTVILASLAGFAVGSVAGMVSIAGGVSAGMSGGDQAAALAAFAPVAAVVTALTVTLTSLLGTVVPTAIYAELRDRIEGARPHALNEVFK